MAAWLRAQGVAGSRLIVEDQALNTTQNAANTYKLLTSAYPQVETLAVVTSDYHVACAGVLLQIWSDYQSQVNGEAALNVAAGVFCATNTPARVSTWWGTECFPPRPGALPRSPAPPGRW